MLISLPNGEYAFGMPVLRCSTCREDRPTMPLVDGHHVCAVCRRPIEPLSAVERYLSANATTAIEDATRAPGATGDAGLTPHPSQRKDGAVPTPTHIDCVHWRELHRGDVIVANPEHPDIPCELPFLDANSNNWDVFIHAGTEFLERTFHVYANTPIQVRHTTPGGGA